MKFKESRMVVLGDSYLTPNYLVDARDSFWGLLANDLNITEIDNYACHRFSLDSMIHILLNEDIDFNRHIVIGIPPIMRESIYIEDKGHQHPKHKIVDWEITEHDVSSMENVTNYHFHDRYNNDYEKVNLFSSEWHEVMTLEKIYLIYNYLKSKNAKFMILNMSKPFQYQVLWPAGMNIIKQVALLEECNIFKDTYQSINQDDGIKPVDFDTYDWMGHHGAEGNLNYYQKVVKPMVEKLGWFS
jgi:hypothetical protein